MSHVIGPVNLFELYILFATLSTGLASCSAGRANLPQPEYVEPAVVLVRKGEDLQKALESARSGDTIKLEARATFEGPFVLPRKSGDGFITITTSAGNNLPPSGVRIDPLKHAAALPRLISANNEPVIATAAGASHYRFIGIEFGGTKDGVGNIIQIGSATEGSADEIPSHIEFDRVYIHSTSPEGQRRGIAANGRHIKIVDSHISDIKRKGDESQAIAAWATDGPIEIKNNYLEAAAENILFGGAGSPLKLVPTDCIVEGNHLNKRDEWRGTEWVVKNLFEIKNGRRIIVRNNLMTNNWTMGQDGTAILFSTRADNGAATVIEDVEFTDNVIRNSDNGISVFGAEGSGGHRLTIRNNIFDKIGKPGSEGSGRFMKSTAWNGLVIANNTIINSGNITSAYSTPTKGFLFRNNIVFENEYGFKGDGTASGIPTIDKFFPGARISGNAIIGGRADRYHRENFFFASLKDLGYDQKRFSFEPGSRFRLDPISGKTLGATANTRSYLGHE